MSLDAWKDANVQRSRQHIEVIAPKTEFKSEPVSPRLRESLSYADRNTTISELCFTPDGRRIIGSGYPFGVIQVWDASSGKQVSQINPGVGYLGGSFSLSPDGTTIFATRSKRNEKRIEKDGQVAVYFEFDGDVRLWDVETGQLRDMLRHEAPRSIFSTKLSPDGKYVCTTGNIAGSFPIKRVVSLWELSTKSFQIMPECSDYNSVFSPDSRSIVYVERNDASFSTAIKCTETATMKTRWSIPIERENVQASIKQYSPSGELIVGEIAEYPNGINKPKKNVLCLWESSSGKEVAKFSVESTDGYYETAFSPDGRLLASSSFQLKSGRLQLFDVDNRRIIKSVEIGPNVRVGKPTFSPGGRWIVVFTQLASDDMRRDLTPDDLAQPHILFINPSNGTICESLVSPPAFCATTMCFSPDGRTLSTPGYGKVHLWDLTKPICGASEK